jgi:hypothetical protein
MIIEHFDTSMQVRLPEAGSNLHRCIMQLAALEAATTGEITEMLNLRRRDKHTPSEVASQLTVLRIRGLVMVVQARKGVSGGSTWSLTQAAHRLIFSKGARRGTRSRNS